MPFILERETKQLVLQKIISPCKQPNVQPKTLTELDLTPGLMQTTDLYYYIKWLTTSWKYWNTGTGPEVEPKVLPMPDFRTGPSSTQAWLFDLSLVVK